MDYTAILSTTLKNYRKKFVDNIFESSAFYYLMKPKVKTEDGGERIVVPLMYGKNTTAGSYSGYDTLDVTPQEGLGAAEFEWKQASVSISISGREERQNKGRSRIINLLEAKVKQAELSLVESLNTQLFSDGTGNDSKDFTGLEAAVDSSGTYAGIGRSTYTWWQANETAVSGALTIASMRTMYNNCSKGGKDTVDLIVTDQDEYEAYEALADSKQTYEMMSAQGKKLLDAGFEVLKYKGSTIVWDESATAGVMYFLNTSHMGITMHKDANFTPTDFVRPADQDAKVAQILVMGNITVDNCARLGKLTSLTD